MATNMFGCFSVGDERLRAGKLQDAEQAFASILKEATETTRDQRTEIAALQSLGDVYLTRGREDRSLACFTKASALYNAAKARCKLLGVDTDTLKHRIDYTEKLFVKLLKGNRAKTFQCGCNSAKHKAFLEKLRQGVEERLTMLDEVFFFCGKQKTRALERLRYDSTRSTYLYIACQMKVFINSLVSECLNVLGTPPCKFALVGLGSMARDEMTPYSDLESAILIEEGKSTDAVKEFFRKLTHYLHLKVINIGETILPAMAITTLNDFLSDDHAENWFYDKDTPKGFAFDGCLPWASKTPLGTKPIVGEEGYELIRTPSEMLGLLVSEEGKKNHLGDMLSRVCWLSGSRDLVRSYESMLERVMFKSTDKVQESSEFENVQQTQRRTLAILGADLKKYDSSKTLRGDGSMYEVKKEIYRFPSITIGSIGLLCGIPAKSSWEILDKMAAEGMLSDDTAHYLRVVVGIATELRLRTYTANKGQSEHISVLREFPNCRLDELEAAKQITVQKKFHLHNLDLLHRFYATVLPLRQVLTRLTENQDGCWHKMCLADANLNDKSHLTEGEICLRLAQYEEAEAHLRHAHRENPENFERARLLSCVLVKTGKLTEALKVLEEFPLSRVTKSETFMYHIHLGSILHDVGRYEDAMEEYTTASTFPDVTGDILTVDKDLAKDVHNLNIFAVKCDLIRNGMSQDTTKGILDVLAAGDGSDSFLQSGRNSVKYPVFGLRSLHFTLCKRAILFVETEEYDLAISFLSLGMRVLEKAYTKGLLDGRDGFAEAYEMLGVAHLKLHHYGEALAFFKRAVALLRLEYGYGVAHSTLAVLSTHIGDVHIAKSEYRVAMGYYEEALVMARCVFGPYGTTPIVAKSLHKIGEAACKAGDLRKAERYHKAALRANRELYKAKPHHPEIFVSLTCLCFVLFSANRPEEAKPYLTEVSTMCDAITSNKTDNPEFEFYFDLLCDMYYKYGRLQFEFGDPKVAVVYLEQCLQIRHHMSDNSDNEKVACALNCLGASWGQLGDSGKAADYFKKCLKICEKIYGKDVPHPLTASALNSLGTALEESDKHLALKYKEESLELFRRIHGPLPHVDTANALHALGTHLFVQFKDVPRAISCLEEALDIFKKLQEDNPYPGDVKRVEEDLRLLQQYNIA